ncbi:unnamed protein product [Closterium sp. Naga37s-1]|nr:unnamed protein product [Closterium sp. Naga37s-1]
MQPQSNAMNAGRGTGARGNVGRGTGARGNAGRGTGSRGNAGRGNAGGGTAGRGAGARENAGRGNAGGGTAGRGKGARGHGGRGARGRGASGRGAGGSANGGSAPGGTGTGVRRNGSNANGGSANQPVHRPRIRRRRVDVVPHTERNGTGEGGGGPSDVDDDDDDDDSDSGDGWNDDDENYLANSLSALHEEEAEDRERVMGTLTDNEVPIADWNRLGVDDTPAAKREMCMGILYGLSEATLKKCRGWANEYKRFMAHELPKLDEGRFGEEAALKNANPDEIGAALEQNMGGSWKMARGDEQWFHGPETNPWRLRKYVTFLANETVAQADRMATLKRPDKTLKKRRQCTPAMLMGRLKALNLLIKLDGAIFRKPVLNLLRDFAECRTWVRVQVRDQYKRFISTGKTNKDFSLNYISAVRHIDWTLCAVGATLLWLHWVYDLVPHLYGDIAPPLDFTEPSTWYDQYLFFPLRAGTEKQIPPTTHHDWAAKILDDAGITCSRVVHATRAGGAQHASADGMPSDQLARLGGWRFIDVMTKHYLTTIPREAVLLKAGFTGVDGDYFLGRATVPVSEELDKLLRKHIFPWAAPDKGQKQCKDYNRKMVKEDKAEKQDTAGLNILKELDGGARMAVAQDLAMYYIHQPRHPYVVNNPLCQTEEFARTGPTADPSPANTPGAAAAPTNATTPTDQGTRKKPAPPTREQTIRNAIVLPGVNASKPSDGWKLYKTTHPLIRESPESLLAQPRGAVTRLVALIGEEGGGQNAINRVKRLMNFIAHRVEQGDNIAVVLDKLDLVSAAVGMLGVSEGIAVKKKSVDLDLSQLKKGTLVEVQLRVKWMLVRDRLVDASLPASEFTVAWPQYCAQMPPLE